MTSTPASHATPAPLPANTEGSLRAFAFALLEGPGEQTNDADDGQGGFHCDSLVRSVVMLVMSGHTWHGVRYGQELQAIGLGVG